MAKEASARIKINKLLEEAGWRFYPEGNKPANIQLESKVAIRETDRDALGDDFTVGTALVAVLLRKSDDGYSMASNEVKYGPKKACSWKGA
jgi:type I restriction enzyme R subunit